jgi:hypothetical protein
MYISSNDPASNPSCVVRECTPCQDSIGASSACPSGTSSETCHTTSPSTGNLRAKFSPRGPERKWRSPSARVSRSPRGLQPPLMILREGVKKTPHTVSRTASCVNSRYESLRPTRDGPRNATISRGSLRCLYHGQVACNPGEIHGFCAQIPLVCIWFLDKMVSI